MATHSAKRAKTTVGLALVLCGLLGVIAWMEFGDNTVSTNKETINRIAITRAGHQDITLVRQNEQWQMTNPFLLTSNPQRVDALLNLPNAFGQHYTVAETDLAATGLDKPQASVQLNDTPYHLGNIDLSGDRRYIKSGDTVSLVPEWVWSLVHGGVTAFADLTVFSELPESIFLRSLGADEAIRELHNNEQWQSLLADKIVPWEYDTVAAALEAESGQHFQISDTNSSSSARGLANIFRLADYAVVQTQPGFAFAISHARLDALLQP